MERSTAIGIACVISAVLFALIATYGLALIGEPQSLWIWRDLLGIMQ